MSAMSRSLMMAIGQREAGTMRAGIAMQRDELQPRTFTLCVADPTEHESTDTGTLSQLPPTAIQEAVHI